MIAVELIGSEALAARLGTMTPRLVKHLEGTLQRTTILLQRTVQQEKLSGQVLKNRTGHLRGSIAQRVEHTPGGSGSDEVAGFVGIFRGPTLRYGRIHEYGGTVTVPTHLRRNKTRGYGTYVRAHPATYPERSFLRSTLAERRELIRAALAKAVADTVAES